MKRLFATATLLLAMITAHAQIDIMAPITPDPELRTGKLDNGLTYYIRHNSKPKGQADFYIVSDVGAIQEQDDQQGLAHFLEHMAFNGTKNLPNKEIIEYLEKIGVKFGTNLNASTSWDVTTYLIKDVPVARPGVVDSALLIMHDWSHFITPIKTEIDKERGVIKEELRTRDNANWRATMEMLKAIGKGTKYTERNLIGYLEGLDSFEPEALISFYERWYRPEYQAIIIVGDIDVDSVEQKLIAQMSDIPTSRGNVPQKEVIYVPDNEEPIVSIYTDPEMQYSSATYFIKRKAIDPSNNSYVYREYLDVAFALFTRMQNERLNDISMLPNAPFVGAYLSNGGLGVIPTLECLSFGVQSSDGKLPEALEAITTEIERTRRHGFNQGEFDRAKEMIMSGAKRAYANRNDRLNGSFVQQYIKNFRFNTATPSAETEWQLDSAILSHITLDEVNKVGGAITTHNNVIVINAPQKKDSEVITEQGVLDIIKRVRNSEVEPLKEVIISEPLIDEDEKLLGSEVISSSPEPRTESTVWRLKNGIEVTVKPTKLKADEVIIRGYTTGGASVLSDDDYYTGMFLPSIMGSSGLSRFSASELAKQLSGKIAAVSLYVNNYTNGVSGSSSVEDTESLLQLLYLNFTAPRFDSTDFETFREQMRANIVNTENDPDYIAAQRFMDVAYGGSPRKRLLSTEMIDNMKFERLKDIHRSLFGNGRDFHFTIVGNIDTAAIKPLIERYIGSIPTSESQLDYVDDKVMALDGIIHDEFEQKMEQPKVSVRILYSGDIEYNLKNKVIATYLKMALDNKYLESVREERGGTYGVGVGLELKRIPQMRYNLNITFDTNVEMYTELIPLIEAEVENIANCGVDNEQMSKSREFLIKDFRNSLENNSGLAGYISALHTSGLDYLSSYEDIVNSITSDDIKRVATQILNDHNRIEVIMKPALDK